MPAKFYHGRPCKNCGGTKRYAKHRNCAVCNTTKMTAWRKANREKARANSRRNDGLPEPTRPCPIVCESCGRPPGEKRGLSLDHSHTSGKFRGWLCFRCNSGIGKLGDDLPGLLRAVAYILAHGD